MKKFVSLFMTLVICFMFSACGAGKTKETAEEMKVTVTDKEGTVSEMTVEELKNTSKNEAQFNKLYNGAKVSFTGTVSEISTNFTINNSSKAYDSIEFEEGLTLYTEHDINTMGAMIGSSERIYDYSEINIGEKLIVEGGTVTNGFGFVDIIGCEKLKKAE